LFEGDKDYTMLLFLFLDDEVQKPTEAGDFNGLI
jgi:hypothetical protein